MTVKKKDLKKQDNKRQSDNDLYSNVLKMQNQIIKRLDKIENYIKFQVYIKLLKYFVVILAVVLGTYFAIPFIQNVYNQYNSVIEQFNGVNSSGLLNLFK